MVVSIAARIAARKLAKKLAKRKYYKSQLKSLKTGVRVKGKKMEARFKFKQKPKHPGGGPDIITKTGYTGEYKVGTRLARRAMYFNRGAGRSESWRAEMSRVFGGLHMSQDPAKVKKSIRVLTPKKHLRKKAEGGFIIGKNVDCSLL